MTALSVKPLFRGGTMNVRTLGVALLLAACASNNAVKVDRPSTVPEDRTEFTPRSDGLVSTGDNRWDAQMRSGEAIFAMAEGVASLVRKKSGPHDNMITGIVVCHETEGNAFQIPCGRTQLSLMDEKDKVLATGTIVGSEFAFRVPTSRKFHLGA